MNIITGITRNKLRVASCGMRVKTAERIVRLIMVFTFTILIGACVSKQPAQEVAVSPKSDVKICSPTIRSVDRLVNYQGVTRFMQTNDIRSQMTGIITRINCAVADHISINQALFVIQPQEAAALQKSKFSSQILTGFSDTVYAHLSGQIKSLNVQVGDFIQIGDVLANCIRSNSMRIIAYIPLEQIAAVEKIKHCTLILPDGSSVDGIVTGKLPAAETQNQTQAYIIEPKKNISLSENVNLSVQFTAEQLQNAVFVPESAVLGNEEQTRFWIMKLMNDSTCIKVQVEKGLKTDSLVQLIGSELTISDLVVSEGAYGLPDSARVQVTNMKNESQSTIKPAANRKSTGSRH